MKRCDNTSVGVLIADPRGRYLLIRRMRPPVGVAPVAGHVDHHGTVEAAAVAEVAEEVGLAVTALLPLIEAWRPNVCRRQPSVDGYGHTWTVFQATVADYRVRCAPAETADPRWCSRRRLQRLANRTVDYAAGRVSPGRFARRPGLEPVWVGFFARLDLVTVSRRDLALVEFLAEHPPPR